MFNKWAKNTLDPQLSFKSIPCGVELSDLNSRLAQYFNKTYDFYEKLFSIIKSESSFYTYPEPLRHPLIFYYGHTSSFYINKLIDGGVIKQHVNQAYESMFAVGVDQNDWDDLDESHYSWPNLEQVQNFRDQVRKVVNEAIQSNADKMITPDSKMWALMMGIDHEKLHIETASVIIRRLPVQEVTARQWTKECPFMRDHPAKVPINRMNIVPKTDYLYDKTMDKADYYGWDCEFGTRRIKTKQFKASKMLVSNAQFLEFFLDDGYKKMKYWTDEGKKWINKSKPQKPVFWIVKNGNRQDIKNYSLKTLTRQISMPWDWPVEVNNLEARAFCNWKSERTGKKLRLPTEDEFYSIRNLLKTDYEDWKYQSVGNINLQFWSSPCPVDMFEIQGFCDIVGNVLQHTITPFYPFDNFKIHPLYEDFTTPCLDSRHDIIKGGCFMNTGNSASKYYRTGFRRHFYLFTGFRYVESDNVEEICEHNLCQSDQTLKEALNIHYFSQYSYLQKVLEIVKMNKNEMGDQSLVVGCSVGRLPIQLSKYFNKSFGIDYTVRYFQMAARLLQKSEISYQGTKIELKNLQLTNELLKKVRLYQMNPVNTDQNKINEISCMVIDGFNLKKNTIKNVIKDCFKLFKKETKCHALIICPDQHNGINDVEKELMQVLSENYEVKIKKCLDFDNSSPESKQKQEGRIYLVEVSKHGN